MTDANNTDLSSSEEPKSKEVKSLDPTVSSFTANGKTYHIERNLSVDRWIRKQELEIELGFGVEFGEMRENWNKVYNIISDRNGKLGDIAVIAYNMSNGISRSFDRQPQILKFCALFMNLEDEDRRTISDEQIEVKINDWRKEGLGIDGFFAFSLSLIKDFRDDYLKATENASVILESLKGSEKSSSI